MSYSRHYASAGSPLEYTGGEVMTPQAPIYEDPNSQLNTYLNTDDDVNLAKIHQLWKTRSLEQKVNIVISNHPRDISEPDPDHGSEIKHLLALLVATEETPNIYIALFDRLEYYDLSELDFAYTSKDTPISVKELMPARYGLNGFNIAYFTTSQELYDDKSVECYSFDALKEAENSLDNNHDRTILWYRSLCANIEKYRDYIASTLHPNIVRLKLALEQWTSPNTDELVRTMIDLVGGTQTPRIYRLDMENGQKEFVTKDKLLKRLYAQLLKYTNLPQDIASLILTAL